MGVADLAQWEWNRRSKATTIDFMFLGLLAMHILEVLFFVGMAGSAIVVLISFVEDLHELVGGD